jgi:hypothetical protein
MKPAIPVPGLTRRYRRQLALDDVGLALEGGQHHDS